MKITKTISYAFRVLDRIERAVGEMDDANLWLTSPYWYHYGGRPGPPSSTVTWEEFWNELVEHFSKDERERRAFRYLQKKKWIQQKKKGEKISLSVSRDAYSFLLRERIRLSRAHLPKDECCLVAFDFPESMKILRDKWRYHLVRCGLHQVQKSVWRTNRDVCSDMAKLVRVLEIGQWVVLYQSKRRIT